MRIAFNLLYLSPGRSGGTEVYAAALLSSLRSVLSADQMLLLLRPDTKHWAPPALVDVPRCTVPIARLGRPGRIAADALLVDTAAQRHGVDVIHSLAYHGPWSGAVPSVLTVHDTHFWRYTKRSLRASLLRFAVPRAVAHARQVICISRFTAAELRTFIPDAEPRIRVIPHGPGSISDKGGWHAQRDPRYLLAFSSVTANKNIHRLLTAWESVACAFPDCELRVIGHAPVDGWPETPRVRRLGFVSEPEKVAQLRGAQALVFPSTYEGFGLPVLEAMTLGTPVIASTTTGVGEVASGAALLISPTDVDGIAHAMRRVLTESSLRAQLSSRGIERAAQLTWDQSAAQHLETYRTALR